MILDPGKRHARTCPDRPARVLSRAFISGVVTVNMTNVHERAIAAPAARVGALLDTLASDDDKFWPLTTF